MHQRLGCTMEQLILAVQYIENMDSNLLPNGEVCRDQTDEEIQRLLFNNDQQRQEQQQQLQEHVVEQLVVAETETTTAATPAIVRAVRTTDGSSPDTFTIGGNGSSFVQTSSPAAAVQQLCFKVVEQSPPPVPKSPPEQQHVISSTTSGIGNGRRTAVTPTTFEILHQQGSSSSIIGSGGNHLVIDESIGVGSNGGGGMAGDSGRRQRPPLPPVLRQGTREVHNKLEKDRRAHLKECFEQLKKQLPSTNDEKKTSNLNILHSALRYISTLKKKERDMEKARSVRENERDNLKSKLLELKREILASDPRFDFSSLLLESDNGFSVSSHQTMSRSIQVAADVNQQQHLQQQAGTTTVVMTAPAAASSSSSAVTSNGNGLVSGAPTRVVAKVPQAQLAAITTTTTAQVGTLKEVSQSSLQTTFAPVLYQGPPVVLQKLAIVHQPSSISKNLGDIFLQQHGGKVVYNTINTNYVVKPVVVVSRPNS